MRYVDKSFLIMVFSIWVKAVHLSQNSGTVPTGGEQSPQSLKFVGNSPHTVPIRGTSGGTVPTHMGNSPHDLGNSPHQPNSPQ